jgi:hypothetical protein
MPIVSRKAAVRLAIIALVLWTAAVNVFSEPIQVVHGQIVHAPSESSPSWGIVAAFDWRHPIRPRKYLFRDLPEPFQQVGMNVFCFCPTYEVIDFSNRWGTVVDPLFITPDTGR